MLSEAPKSLYWGVFKSSGSHDGKNGRFFVESITAKGWTSLFCPVFDSRTLVSAPALSASACPLSPALTLCILHPRSCAPCTPVSDSRTLVSASPPHL